jgi:hypothetical protein
MSNFIQITNTKLEEVKGKLDALPGSISSNDAAYHVHNSKTTAEHLDDISTKNETLVNASVRDINNTGSIGDGSSNATSVCLGYDRTNGQGRSILVDSGGKVETNVTMNAGHGLATESKQDDIINATNRAINNTGSIGDGSTNATAVCLGYDRTNGQGRSILVNSDGEQMVQNNHSWTTSTVMSSVVINGGSSATSSVIDLGANYGHEIDPLLYVYDQTSGRSCEISGEMSLDGVNFFPRQGGASTITQTTDCFFTNSDIELPDGFRYYRIKVSNTDGTPSNTETVTLTVGSYV